MQFDNQKTRNVADVVAKILAGESAKQEPQMLDEELVGNQHKIDANKNKKIDAHDFKLLRAQKDKEKANSQKFGKDVKEEVEELDEIFDKSDPVGTKKRTAKGVATKTATGMKHENVPEKDVEAGSTDWDKEEKLAKTHLSPKPARKKYGARQNYVRSTRVNESFSGLLSVYKEQGLKGLAEAMIKEEPTNDQYNAELEDNKAKAEGKKKQPELTKGYVQAVKQEETEIEVFDADKINGVRIDTIEEREMTDAEMKKREDIVKGMKKGMEGFKQRYGERAKSVMYATATKQAMKD